MFVPCSCAVPHTALLLTSGPWCPGQVRGGRGAQHGQDAEREAGALAAQPPQAGARASCLCPVAAPASLPCEPITRLSNRHHAHVTCHQHHLAAARQQPFRRQALGHRIRWQAPAQAGNFLVILISYIISCITVVVICIFMSLTGCAGWHARRRPARWAQQGTASACAG
jgi:hypothetical protein